MSTLNGQMDSRLRGNDTAGFFMALPELAWPYGQPLDTGSPAIMPLPFLPRHCEERSDEAISLLTPSKSRLLRRYAPRNDKMSGVELTKTAITSTPPTPRDNASS